MYAPLLFCGDIRQRRPAMLIHSIDFDLAYVQQHLDIVLCPHAAAYDNGREGGVSLLCGCYVPLREEINRLSDRNR
jgi:hypothetical protein